MESKVKSQSQGEKFSGILVSKDVFLDIKLLRYKFPCCYRELEHWWNEICQNIHLKISKTLLFKKNM